VTPSASVELRPIRDGDLPFLCSVYSSTRTDELALTDWSDEQKASFLRSQFEAQHRYYRETYNAPEFCVVLVDGQPAGRLYLGRFEGEMRIIDIALLPEFRGRGIATRLMGEILREAGRQGVPVRIHVERFNPALRFYERLGFRLLEDRGVYLFLEHPAGSADARATP